MARPSLKKERRSEILDAYGRCLLRFGIAGATLSRTAEEAGLARALIRHNVGNKDELLEAFLDRYFRRSTREAESFFASLPSKARIPALLDGLFDPACADLQDSQLIGVLMVAASERPALAQRLQQWIEVFIALIAGVLASEFPQAERESIGIVARGVVAIHGDAQGRALLGHQASHVRALAEAASILIRSLETGEH